MDLRTNYMGMELRNPLVASSSPVSEDVANIRQLEDAGAAAVVLFSLFEEQIRHEEEAVAHLTSYGAESFPEALSYFPEVEEFLVGAEQYLDLIQRARAAVDIPVIASLNGITNEGWIDYAKRMEEVGASAIELNIFYIPADIEITGRQVEDRYVEILQHVKAAVTVPVALKLSPFFSAIGNMASRLDEAGADALVLFNRFYQPDFDIDRLEVALSLELSEASEIRLPLAWIAMLYGRIHASLAATRGVQSATEIIKYVMAGADVVMTTSALLKNGIKYTERLLRDLEEWMELKEYASISQMKGSMSEKNVADPTAFKRGNYVRILEQYKSAYIS